MLYDVLSTSKDTPFTVTMASLRTIRSNEAGSANPEQPARGWPLVLALVTLLSVSGWAYLIAMVADMVPVMDMSEAGPGMVILNSFNQFAGLPAEARAALAVLCLPTSATFGMPGADMTAVDLAKIFLMWAMMALAMMLPTAVPMLRAYHSALAARPGTSAPGRSVVAAMFGYLAVWLGYAVVATAAQWALSVAGAMTTMMAPASMALTASVLLAAGLYQFTPAKKACLSRCWYPRWVFVTDEGAPGILPGFREGLIQGWVCLGCCWAVMTVMFAVGLMNIVWIALLGALMAVEKTFPSRILPPAIGVVLLVWAGVLVSLILLGNATS
ncbi:putative metal-binding membrane protein [Labrenzia sp. MBR-25]